MKGHLKNHSPNNGGLIASPLSKELREKYAFKTLGVRKGDTVNVIRGDFQGVDGKVNKVDTKRGKLYIDGVTREKADGSLVFVPILPSKVKLTRINTDDKWRKNILQRHGAKLEETKPQEKPEKSKDEKKKTSSRKKKLAASEKEES
jgi:large subunit ribosomal protein L24